MNRNFHRNMRGTGYLVLQEHRPDMVVRCPVLNRDGTPIDEDDVKGCGSSHLSFDGEVYDCLDCGIFFAPYAADPPHRREEGRDDRIMMPQNC